MTDLDALKFEIQEDSLLGTKIKVIGVGGGAVLNGMCDVAEQTLDCQARNGLPVGIDGWPEEIDNPAWATAAGLAMWSGRLKLRRQPKRRAPDLLKLILK